MKFTIFRFGKNLQLSKASGPGRKIGATLFFGLFLVIGLFASYFVGGMVLQSLATYTWKATPAKILHSAVGEDSGKDSPFSVEVRFQYQWEGQTHTSTRYSLQNFHQTHYAAVQKKVNALPVGQSVTCLVNPSRPTEAILQREPPWFALFVLIPLVFVAVGGGGIFFTWFSQSARTGSVSPVSPGKDSGKKSPATLIGVIFTLVGAGLLIFWFLPTFTKAQASRNWQKTSCTIIFSRVKAHAGDDSTTYSVDVFYRYKVAGREYKSNRYRHFGGSSSGHEAKAEVVQRYPPGSEQVCYVDPESPEDAVLKPGVGWAGLLGLIPGVFLLVGVALLIGRMRAAASTRSPFGSQHLPDDATGGTEPVVLKSTVSPLIKLLGISGVAIFWNGITSIFLWQVVKSFQRGHPEWFLTVFLIPFVLVGFGLLGAIVYFALALTNPRCRLQMDPVVLRPGKTLTATWEFRGSVHRLHRLRIFLEGREEATYQRGTSSYVDREVFARLLLAEITSWMEMNRGTAQCLLPMHTLPSFTAEHNKVIWALKVEGTIAHWPDVNEEYLITILPGKVVPA